MMIKAFLVYILFLSHMALAAPTKYKGVVKNEKGEILYFENHEVQFDESGQVLNAKTIYDKEDGTVLGKIESDFTTRLTAPAYRFQYGDESNQHGIRYKEDGSLTLWTQDQGEKEKTKSFAKDKWPKEVLLVGCQGLHYYLQKNISEVKPGFEKKIKLLIPGKLDYFSFRLRHTKETEKKITLVADIDSIWLRLFAPKMTLIYEKSTGRLLKYEGISNLLDDNGDVQNVVIDYQY